jgi:hypothetical protein
MEEFKNSMVSQATENFDDAKAMFRNDPVFNKFVVGLIAMMKDEILTAEQILTGCALAVGEFEYHIEPESKQNG